jgi:uncharacterized protein YecE (DUF72 family)
MVESWARRTAFNPRFTFTVKVWRRFTHRREADRAGAEGFIHTFDSLFEAGAFGAFLLQFPWSFKHDAENRGYVEKLSRWFEGYPSAVEFRHASWNAPEAVSLVTDGGLAFCNIDQPVIGDSLPPTEHVTTDGHGYIRLHGRNRKNWFRKDAGRDARYDYCYRESELEQWRERAVRMLTKTQKLFIVANNHFRGQALVNAFQLRSMLERIRPDIPATLTSAFPELERIAARSPRQGDLLDE